MITTQIHAIASVAVVNYAYMYICMYVHVFCMAALLERNPI